MRVWRGAFVAVAMGMAGLVWGADAATRPATGAGKLPFTISKETTAITGPLKADGTVDYVAALNEKYGKGVTPENNGFVVWLKVVGTGDEVLDPKTKGRVLELCGAKEMAAGADVWVSYVDFLKSRGKKTTAPIIQGGTEYPVTIKPTAYPWKAAQYPLAAEYLKAREGQLSLVNEALKREKWWEPAALPAGWASLSVFNDRGRTKEVVESFNARAMMHLGGGDFDGFLNDIISGDLLARKTGVAGMELYSLGRLLGAGGFTEKQCRAIRQALGTIPDGRSWSARVDTYYRWEVLNLVEWAGQGRGASLPADSEMDPYPLFTALKTVEPGQVDFDLVLKLVNHDIDKIVASLEDPRWGDGQVKLKEIQDRLTLGARRLQYDGMNLSMKPGETREAYSRRVATAIMGQWGKPISGLGFDVVEGTTAERTIDLELAQVRLLSAAAEWKARNGKWPDTLEELVPQYVKEIPADPYSRGGAGRLRYKATKAGAQIYSVGPNGKDDGGIPSLDNKYQGDDFGPGAG